MIYMLFKTRYGIQALPMRYGARYWIVCQVRRQTLDTVLGTTNSLTVVDKVLNTLLDSA